MMMKLLPGMLFLHIFYAMIFTLEENYNSSICFGGTIGWLTL